MVRISYGNSVRLSVLVSHPGTVPSPGEIGFLLYDSVDSLAFWNKILCP